MKIILAIISDDDKSKVIRALNQKSFQVTHLSTTGGFLSKGNCTILVGCKDEEVQAVIDIIGSQSKTRKEFIPSAQAAGIGMMNSTPIEVKVGGATIFVLNVDQFVKI